MTIVALTLIIVAVAPLVILAIYVIADRFNSRLAGGLLDATAFTLGAQWTIGCIVNVLGGLALIGVGLWVLLHETAWSHRLAALFVVIPAGAWRAWRGYIGFPRSPN